MKYLSITSFFEVQLKSNSLLVLDIDETVMSYPQFNSNWWKAIYLKHYQAVQDCDEANRLTYDEWMEEMHRTTPSHMDEFGLNCLLGKAEELNVQVIFLTARPKDLHPITHKHLRYLNVPHTQEDLYYSSGSDKGTVLESIIREKYGYINDVVFIDDLETNLQDVMQRCSKNVRAYKFCSL